MRLTVAAVGRAKSGPEQALWQDYTKRLSWPVQLKEVEVKGNSAPAERQAREGTGLLAAMAGGRERGGLRGRRQAAARGGLGCPPRPLARRRRARARLPDRWRRRPSA